jgi:hypothetical protein
VAIYNVTSNSWTTSSLSQARDLLAATSVKDIAIFAGGSASSGNSAVVDIYNVTSNTWTTSSLSQARNSLEATSVKDIVIFAGGTASSYSAIVDMFVQLCSNDADCDQRIFCDGLDTCSNDGFCISSGSSNEECNDGNSCTEDVCDISSGCVFTPIQGCGGANDDPHFIGFHNQRFDANGYSGNIYNIISQYPQQNSS